MSFAITTDIWTTAQMTLISSTQSPLHHHYLANGFMYVFWQQVISKAITLLSTTLLKIGCYRIPLGRLGIPETSKKSLGCPSAPGVFRNTLFLTVNVDKLKEVACSYDLGMNRVRALVHDQ